MDPAQPETMAHATAASSQSPWSDALKLLEMGGPIGWALAVLSVAALAIVFWKVQRFAALGVWRAGPARRALTLWRKGAVEEAIAALGKARGAQDRVLAVALRSSMGRAPDAAREESERVAKAALAEMRVGLRGLESIVTIAPLLGLLGTVLGMIAAFQALQNAGGRADPSILAGGIWEAMLTTAAGMAVAIPAGLALNWCESVVERTRLRIESAAGEVLAGAPKYALREAA